MRYLLFFVLAIFLGCNNQKADQTVTTSDSASASARKDSSSFFIHQFADTALQSKIEDTLMKLSFVKQSHAYIDSFSNHKHGMAFITDTAGGKVTVTAGYNGPERFETYYNFTVDPKTFEIKILDATTGDYVSIEEYIKKNKE